MAPENFVPHCRTPVPRTPRRPLSRGAKVFGGLAASAVITSVVLGSLGLAGALPWQRTEIWGWQVGELRGSEIAIAFSYGDCDHYGGYKVTETPTTVTVTVRGRNYEGVCTQQLAVPCLRIRLQGPLGERSLFDGKDPAPVTERILRLGGYLPPCDLSRAS